MSNQQLNDAIAQLATLIELTQIGNRRNKMQQAHAFLERAMFENEENEETEKTKETEETEKAKKAEAKAKEAKNQKLRDLKQQISDLESRDEDITSSSTQVESAYSTIVAKAKTPKTPKAKAPKAKAKALNFNVSLENAYLREVFAQGYTIDGKVLIKHDQLEANGFWFKDDYKTGQRHAKNPLVTYKHYNSPKSDSKGKTPDRYYLGNDGYCYKTINSSKYENCVKLVIAEDINGLEITWRAIQVNSDSESDFEEIAVL